MSKPVRWYQRIVESVSRRKLDPAPTSTFHLVELPRDLVEHTLAFLSGFDLLPLSHVNRQLYYGVLAGDADIWQRLAPPQSPLHTLKMCEPSAPPKPTVMGFRRGSDQNPPTAKQRYFARRAVRFHGVIGNRGGAIPTSSPRKIARSGSFSFDVEFSLLPTLDDNATRVGGILLGAQSVSATRDSHADFHQQLVHTDPDGNLYCSVMRHKPIVAKSLEFQRWYHVALVFDVTGPSRATQRVYLDGELVDTVDGWLHDEWACLRDAQVGTGCITGGALGPGHCGWYAFNGLVNNFRFWNGALQHVDVRRLLNSSEDPTPTEATCVWSMRDVAQDSAVGKVSLVRSTGPAERLVSHVETTDELSRGSIPVVFRMMCCTLPSRSWQE